MEVRPVPCDETPHADEPALPYARRIAEAKLRAALAAIEGRRILAADTVVWLDADAAPLGKPADANACRAMLESIVRMCPDHDVTQIPLNDIRV